MRPKSPEGHEEKPPFLKPRVRPRTVILAPENSERSDSLLEICPSSTNRARTWFYARFRLSSIRAFYNIQARGKSAKGVSANNFLKVPRGVLQSPVNKTAIIQMKYCACSVMAEFYRQSTA